MVHFYFRFYIILHEESLDKPRIKDIQQNNRPGLFKNIKVIKDREMLQIKRDQRFMKTKSNMRSWIRSQTEGKKWQ